VCNATVTARDGGFSAVLSRNFDGNTSCAYVGPLEREGTYSIEVRSGSEAKTVDNVTVSKDACNVRTRRLTVTLDR
jgi:hypothetical protein